MKKIGFFFQGAGFVRLAVFAALLALGPAVFGREVPQYSLFVSCQFGDAIKEWTGEPKAPWELNASTDSSSFAIVEPGKRQLRISVKAIEVDERGFTAFFDTLLEDGKGTKLKESFSETIPYGGKKNITFLNSAVRCHLWVGDASKGRFALIDPDSARRKLASPKVVGFSFVRKPSLPEGVLADRPQFEKSSFRVGYLLGYLHSRCASSLIVFTSEKKLKEARILAQQMVRTGTTVSICVFPRE